MRATYHRRIAAHPDLHSSDPEARAAAASALHPRARRREAKRYRDWPDFSPGALNAWLLLISTKPPSWRDPLVLWPVDPPTLGTAHPGFFYPDPLGFWAEVRRWSVTLIRPAWPDVTMAGALSVTAVMHGDDPAPLVATARAGMRPRVLLFLDEHAWAGAGIDVDDVLPYAMADPHRAGQSYEGFWATAEDGTVVGKAPQHPAAHKLYRPADIDAFLDAAPVPHP